MDIDGVLHRGIARRAGNRVVSSAPGNIELFEYASVLDELLCPYPDVEIVLSSDWALVFGVEYSVAAMPLSSLRDRVVGATYDGCTFNEMFWPLLSRGKQVLDYVARHSLTKWLAIDDRVDGFESCRGRLVACQTEVGLGDPAVIELFRQRLRQFFSDATVADASE